MIDDFAKHISLQEIKFEHLSSESDGYLFVSNVNKTMSP